MSLFCRKSERRLPSPPSCRELMEATWLLPSWRTCVQGGGEVRKGGATGEVGRRQKGGEGLPLGSRGMEGSLMQRALGSAGYPHLQAREQVCLLNNGRSSSGGIRVHAAPPPSAASSHCCRPPRQHRAAQVCVLLGHAPEGECALLAQPVAVELEDHQLTQQGQAYNSDADGV